MRGRGPGDTPLVRRGGGVMERLMTTVEVAQLLACSRQKVEALCRSGELPAMQTEEGGPWRIRPEAVREYVERLERQASERAARRAAMAAEGEEVRRVVREVRAGRIAVPERIGSSRRRRRLVSVGGVA